MKLAKHLKKPITSDYYPLNRPTPNQPQTQYIILSRRNLFKLNIPTSIKTLRGAWEIQIRFKKITQNHQIIKIIVEQIMLQTQNTISEIIRDFHILSDLKRVIQSDTSFTDICLAYDIDDFISRIDDESLSPEYLEQLAEKYVRLLLMDTEVKYLTKLYNAAVKSHLDARANLIIDYLLSNNSNNINNNWYLNSNLRRWEWKREQLKTKVLLR